MGELESDDSPSSPEEWTIGMRVPLEKITNTDWVSVWSPELELDANAGPTNMVMRLAVELPVLFTVTESVSVERLAVARVTLARVSLFLWSSPLNHVILLTGV